MSAFRECEQCSAQPTEGCREAMANPMSPESRAATADPFKIRQAYFAAAKEDIRRHPQADGLLRSSVLFDGQKVGGRGSLRPKRLFSQLADFKFFEPIQVIVEFHHPSQKSRQVWTFFSYVFCFKIVLPQYNAKADVIKRQICTALHNKRCIYQNPNTLYLLCGLGKRCSTKSQIYQYENGQGFHSGATPFNFNNANDNLHLSNMQVDGADTSQINQSDRRGLAI